MELLIGLNLLLIVLNFGAFSLVSMLGNKFCDWRMEQVNGPIFYRINKVLNKHEKRLYQLERANNED